MSLYMFEHANTRKHIRRPENRASLRPANWPSGPQIYLTAGPTGPLQIWSVSLNHNLIHLILPYIYCELSFCSEVKLISNRRIAIPIFLALFPLERKTPGDNTLNYLRLIYSTQFPCISNLSDGVRVSLWDFGQWRWKRFLNLVTFQGYWWLSTGMNADRLRDPS